MKWPILAIKPPKNRKTYAMPVAWTLASIFLIFVLVHLIRIDKLIPVVAETLGTTGATWFVSLIVIMEVFALPFLLRLRLSPLFRIMSGLFVVLVPLIWTCFTIWAINNGHSTGQFSSYVSTPSSWWLIILDLLWLVISYWTLWLLNYERAFKDLKNTSKKHAKSV